MKKIWPALLIICLSLLIAVSVPAQKSGRETRPDPAPSKVYSPGEPKSLVYEAGATKPNEARMLTAGEETSRAWSLIELTENPGTKTTWHRNPNNDQAYYVLEGVFTVKVEDKMYELPAGGYVFIPRGTAHGTGNVGSVPVKVLLIDGPAGFEHYFRARADLLKTTDPKDPAFKVKMSEIRMRFEVEELGVWDPGQPGSVALPQPTNAEDEQAIRDALTRFYEGWNTHDADKMVSIYAEDIDHINVFAEWKKGKSAMREAARKLHAGPAKNDHKTFTIEKIRFVKPDVAVIQVRSLSIPCGCGNLGTYVMSKESGKWLVLSFTNVEYDLDPKGEKAEISKKP